MSVPSPRPTREQVEQDLVVAEQPFLHDKSTVAGALLRLAAEVRALRAELEALGGELLFVSGRRWAAHATILRREREEAREALGLEMGMRTAAVDELETLRRRLWAVLDADQLSDDDTVDRLRAALAARTPQPAEPTRHLVILSGLADEIDQHAAIAARPGQMGDLERIACAVRDVANELAPLPTVSDGEDETSRAVSRLMFDARPVDHAAEQVAVRTVDLARVLNEFIQYAAAGINKPRQEGP